ncbi:MAG: ClpXP protease specificity-enhancing factor [Sulfuritalea sp.]|nr:ClpXP protease specificity-enhancing factor [Sulfuritalea sp.]
MPMKSTKPYLIRAIHEWCADQGFTPYLAVKVDATTRVPREFVKDGEIVLNVGIEATHQLQLGNEEITFQARFGGKAFPVVVPIERVAAIYASENGEGMAFEVTDKIAADAAGAAPQESPPQDAPSERPSGKPFLTRVK